MKSPLGMDEEEWKIRNAGCEHFKRFSSWRQGYDAAKEGLKVSDCPYTLDQEIIKLLKKRTRWMLGFEEWSYRPRTKRKHKN